MSRVKINRTVSERTSKGKIIPVDKVTRPDKGKPKRKKAREAALPEAVKALPAPAPAPAEAEPWSVKDIADASKALVTTGGASVVGTAPGTKELLSFIDEMSPLLAESERPTEDKAASPRRTLEQIHGDDVAEFKHRYDRAVNAWWNKVSKITGRQQTEFGREVLWGAFALNQILDTKGLSPNMVNLYGANKRTLAWAAIHGYQVPDLWRMVLTALTQGEQAAEERELVLEDLRTGEHVSVPEHVCTRHFRHASLPDRCLKEGSKVLVVFDIQSSGLRANEKKVKVFRVDDKVTTATDISEIGGWRVLHCYPEGKEPIVTKSAPELLGYAAASVEMEEVVYTNVEYSVRPL